MKIFDIFKKNGQYLKYYENGSIYSKLNYKNGKLHDRCVFYFKNGNKFKEEFYKEGILNGKSIGYFENGVIGRQGNYIDGRKDGEFIYYNLDGTLDYKCILNNGLEWNGKFIYKNSPTGMVNEVYTTHIGNFVNGNKNGKWTYFNENGIIIKDEIYKDNELIQSKGYIIKKTLNNYNEKGLI